MDKKSILIIDDDRGILDGFKLLLERKGYLIDTAETGSEAIEKVRSKYFNLALIDIRLPDIDGTALLSEFRELNPEMKKIIITGYSTRENAIESLNQGANAYLVPIPDPHPKTCINFYQQILFPGKFAVIVQQSHIRKLRFKY